MILQNQKAIDVTIEGEILVNSKMEIDADSLGFFMQMVSKFYADSVGSPIRELTSNAWDSHVKAGTDKPIMVKLGKNNTGNWEFTVRDYGLGIDQDLVDNVLKKYGKSTKRDDAKQLGAFGLGFKSPLAYDSVFYFTGWKDGKERKWMMREGEEGNEIDLLYEQDSTEPTGALITVPVHNWDVRDFSSKIREQLCYFSNVYITDEYRAFKNDFKIYQTEDFKWSEVCDNTELHLCLSDVYYPLDFKKLNIPRINIPIGLKFNLTDGIEPLPARESFKYNNQVKEIILNKIKAVSEFFIKKYNETVKEFDSLYQAWDFIDNSDRWVELEGKRFNVSELEEYSNVKFAEPRIKTIKFLNPKRFKTNYNQLVKDYKIVAELDYNGRMKEKDASKWMGDLLDKKGKNLLLDQDVRITGFFRDFLKDTPYKYFIKKKNTWDTFVKNKEDLDYFKQQLHLKKFPKNQWRDVIQEWQENKEQFLKELLVDGTQFHLSDEFLQYKEDNKAKKSYGGSNYKRLYREQGDVILGLGRNKVNGSGVVFEKATFKINELHKYKGVSFVFPEEFKEAASKYFDIFIKNNPTNKNYRIFTAGKKEILKIQNIHNMIIAKDESPKQERIWQKIASAALFSKVLRDYSAIFKHKTGIVQDVLKPLNEAHSKLVKYVKDHSIGDTEVSRAIVQKAKETNDFDKSLWSEYLEVKKAVSDLDFVKFITIPNSWDDYSNKEVSRFINQMLLFKKLKKDDILSEYELVPKAPVEVLENFYSEKELYVDSEGELVD